MKEIEAIKQALAAYDAADCGRTEQRAILDIEDLASPSLFKTVLAHIDAQAAEIERLRADAERYQRLRKQHWNSSDIAVVVSPKRQTRLGSICPSLGLLDDTIDHMRKETP